MISYQPRYSRRFSSRQQRGFDEKELFDGAPSRSSLKMNLGVIRESQNYTVNYSCYNKNETSITIRKAAIEG